MKTDDFFSSDIASDPLLEEETPDKHCGLRRRPTPIFALSTKGTTISMYAGARCFPRIYGIGMTSPSKLLTYI